MKKFFVTMLISLVMVCQAAKAQNIVYSIGYNAHYTIDYSINEVDEDYNDYYIKTECEAGFLLFDDGSLMIIVQFKDNRVLTAHFQVQECLANYGIAFCGMADSENESYVCLNNNGSLTYYHNRYSLDYDYELEGDPIVTKEQFAKIYKDFKELTGPFFSHFTSIEEGRAARFL